MNMWTNLISAICAGYTPILLLKTQPDAFKLRRDNYPVLWAYYSNELFDTALNPQWAGYRTTYNLYRQIRPIYNPTRRLVDFYAASVWPGVLSEDGLELPDGMPIAVPFQ
jgi:hypothetical protein